jgi:hypothetical protein
MAAGIVVGSERQFLSGAAARQPRAGSTAGFRTGDPLTNKRLFV